MKNILITGDLLRASPQGTPNQNTNIQWLYHLLNWQISNVIKETRLKIVLPDRVSTDFCIDTFYEKCGLETCEASWIKIYDQSQVPDAAANYFEQQFSGNFIIGYELPDIFINLFNQFEIKYLDLAIHPIRYLDDIFLGARSNCTEIFSVLLAHALPVELFSVYAGLHKATVARRPEISLEKNSCLFVGQTEVDRSQIKDGRLLTLADFEGNLRALEDRYSTIYYKPHPYARSKEAIFDIISDSQKIQFIDENIYRLLASEEIEKIFTISSSVYFESRYFGKAGEAFFTDNLDRFHFDPATPARNGYVPLLDDFLYPKFWSRVLAPHFQTGECASFNIPRKTSRLRTSLGCFWGYNFLDAEILYQDIIPKKLCEERSSRDSGFRSFFNKFFANKTQS